MIIGRSQNWMRLHVLSVTIDCKWYKINTMFTCNLYYLCYIKSNEVHKRYIKVLKQLADNCKSDVHIMTNYVMNLEI